MDGTGSGSCPVAGFGVSDVKQAELSENLLFLSPHQWSVNSEVTDSCLGDFNLYEFIFCMCTWSFVWRIPCIYIYCPRCECSVTAARHLLRIGAWIKYIKPGTETLLKQKHPPPFLTYVLHLFTSTGAAVAVLLKNKFL